MKIIISERQFKRLIKNKSLITENFLDKVKLILSRIKKKKDGGVDQQTTQKTQTTQTTQTADEPNVEDLEKSLVEFAKKMKSANLSSYSGQLRTIIEPLGSLYGDLTDLNAEECRRGIKPGTLAAERMEPVKNQIYDLFQRVYVDMKTELISNNYLTKEEIKNFTIDDAIEMMYRRYNEQKGFLSSIAKSIIKTLGGGFISAQMLTIISDGIRKKFGDKTGGLANSIMTDFIGGLVTIMGDDSMADCVPMTASSAQEAGIRQGL